MACNYLEFDINAIDLADATGNSGIYPYIDGTVYGVYQDCSGNTITDAFTSSGTYSASTCFDDLALTNVIYYKNDAILDAAYSSFINTTILCGPTPDPTPSATPDSTPSSTPDSTPTHTPTSTIGTNNPYCYEINYNTTNLDGCNGTVDVQETITISLFDQYGNPFVTPVTVYFDFTNDWNDYQDTGNDSGTSSFQLQINPGNSTGQYQYYSFFNEVCNYSSLCNGSCYHTITNVTLVNTPYGLEVCSGFILPTPTPTPNSTPAPTPDSTPSSTPASTPSITYYYYNMLPCTGVGNKVGRSINGGLQGTWVQTSIYTCYLLPDVAPSITPQSFDFDLDTLIFPNPTDCSDSACIAPPPGPTPTPTPDPTPNPTPDPTPNPTPNPTPSQTPCAVVSFNGYSGLTLSDACNQLYPGTVYYCGSLGVGTDLYADALFTYPVNTPGYYYDPFTNQVYHVGLPSVQDGRVTDIQYCTPPTPTPTPTNTETQTPTPTPTLSPGASPYPTDTPTPTPTVTPSPTPYRTITISNSNDYGVNISNVNSTFEITYNGVFPITSGQSINGFSTGATTGDTITFDFTGGTPFEFYVYLNGTLNNSYSSYSPTSLVYDIVPPLDSNDNLTFQLVNATTSPTPTPTNTQTPTGSDTPTPTPTNTETPTQTPSGSDTPTPTPTNTQTPTGSDTPTPTPTNTQTPSETPTQTPTNTGTPTPTPTLGYTVQFVDCSDSSNIFRFNDPAIPSTLGITYYITGSTQFTGCATSVVNDGTGPQYDGYGVSFLMTAGGCGDNICPRSSSKASLLSKCSDKTIFYANVEEDTAFVGATYLYNNECYSWVEFSGPGGPDLGSPSYSDCASCLLNPTPTPTPYTTPTITPTVSSTPAPCSYTTFCLNSGLMSLLNYNGIYSDDGTYNGRQYYVGNGITTAYIYYTGIAWCLSESLGGSCILQGATPCYSQCPDISANDFIGGVCPTPTPTPINCNTFDFNAYFDCDWEPIPTPTPSVDCADVNFEVDYLAVTPTPSPTGAHCTNKAVIFHMSGYTPSITPTITNTPSVTLTRTVDVQGKATFVMLDERFSCVSVKVLQDCSTGDELYTADSLVFSGISIVVGMTFFATINSVNRCVTYTRDDSSISSNANVNSIFQIYGSCEYCSIYPTPTPTVTNTATSTSTPTPTQTSTPAVTMTQTPSQTASQSPTPSLSATYGSTPTPTETPTSTQTPTQTQTPTGTATNTPTPTQTPTMTPSPVYVYVAQSCSSISGNIVTVIQSLPLSFTIVANQTFKDSNCNCWIYLGRFDSNYIAPPNTTPITYNGNYFSSASSVVFEDCTSCQSINKPTIIGFSEDIQTAGECYNRPNYYEETRFPSATFNSPALVSGIITFYYNDGSSTETTFNVGDTIVVGNSYSCGCVNDCVNLINAVVTSITKTC
jgi:hypothetical protein